MPIQDTAELNQRFAIRDHLAFKLGAGDLVYADITNAHASARLCLQGAHLMTWQPVGQEPVLWLSPEARCAPGKSIRGGVPVCWPWFGPHVSDGSQPAHGFARTVPWEVTATKAMEDGGTQISLTIDETVMRQAGWAIDCRVKLVISIGRELRVDLVTFNTGHETFELGEALHTYFQVSDVRNVCVRGLEDCLYIDKVDAGARKQQQGPVIIDREVDRIYLPTESDCCIDDPGYKRRIRIAKLGSRSTVVWNPWVEKAEKMGDLGHQGHLYMLCVETCNAAEDVISLAPGEGHQLHAIISVESLD